MKSEARFQTNKAHVVALRVLGGMDPAVDNDQVPNVVLDELHHLVHGVALPGDLLAVTRQPHGVPAD